MGVRDALLHNVTGSNFEALQDGDTARIKGDFSIQNTSRTEIFGVDVSTAKVNVAGNITSSGDISGSVTSTGSFGRLVASTYIGDGKAIRQTLVRSSGLITSSAQIASDISGAFNRGFFFGFQQSSSISGGLGISASFGRLQGNQYFGDGSGLASTLPRTPGLITGSAQLASNISGSFNKGFEFTGTIKSAGGGPGVWSTGASIGFNLSSQHVSTGASPNAILNVYGTGADIFEGVSWSEITSAPNPTSYGMATGPYDAALIVGGNRSGSISWNGSSWQAEGSTNREMTVLAAGAGTTEAGLVFGGNSGSANVNSADEASAQTEAYDGSSWSECNDMLIPRFRGFQTGIGTQNSTISVGGCGQQGATINPPSPYSPFTFTEARTQGDHMEEWNGVNWTYRGNFPHPSSYSYFMHSGGGVGTANVASFFGGYTRALGGSGHNSTHYHWDGTAFSDGTGMLFRRSNNRGAGQGGVGGAHTTIGGGAASPGPTLYNNTGFVEDYEPTLLHSGSFGRLVATTFGGDGSGLKDTLTRVAGLVTGSAQIASRISGSFNKGFTFTTTSSLGSSSGSLISAPATAWSTGPDVNTAANNQTAADGTQNAAMVFGGRLGVNPASVCGQKITEEYDGTSWSAGGNMVHNRQNAQGGGTQTAGWAYGGISGSLSGPIAYCSTGDKTEEYDGDVWSVSEGVIGINGQAYGAGGGTQNAALTHGGNRAPDGASSNVGSIKLAYYDGTDWAECANSPAQRLKHGAVGTSAAMMFAGNENYPTPGAPTRLLSNEYSDSTDTWTECPNLIYGLKHGSHSGTTNNYLAVGGYEGPGNASPTTVRGCAQKFDGTSWSETVGMLEPIIREGQGGAGAAIIAGGYSYPFATEANSFLYNEYDANLTVDRLKANHLTGDGCFIRGFFPDVVSGSAQIASDISGSFNKGFEYVGQIGSLGTVGGSWSTATNMPANFYGGAGAGRSQNAALHWGGRGPAPSTVHTNCSIEWNGISWSATLSNFNKSHRRHSGAGNTESALSVGGYDYPTALNGTEYFNGSNWAECANLPHVGMDGATVGVDANILLVGGGNHPGVSSANVDKYSLAGNAWSQETDAPTNVGGEGAAGTSEAAIIPIYSPSEGSLHYNDGTWSEISSTLTDRGNGVGIFGTQNDAVAVGGCNNSGNSRCCTEIWNGTSWVYGNAMNNGRTLNNGRTIGTGCAGVAFSSAYSSTTGPNWSCDTEVWDGSHIGTGSFGQVISNDLRGDGCGLTNIPLDAGVISGSAQIATAISGSILGGTGYTTTAGWHHIQNGIVSGSIFSTGSFGLVNAKFLKGDGTSISSSIVSSITHITASSEIAAGISASFQGGFESTGNILDQKSAVHSDGVWSGGASMVGTYHAGGGAGTSQNAALHWGGRGTPGSTNSATTNTEEWNGTSWTEQDNLPESHRCVAGAGSQNSALSMGGADAEADVLYYNGESWAEKANLPAGKKNGIGVGKDADALIMGGGNAAHPSPGNSSTDVDKYSLAGNAWSEETSTPVAVGETGAAGTTEALIIGLYGASEGSLVYNGTSFSEVASTNVAKYNAGMFGTQNDAVHVGARFNGGDNRCCTEIWNGLTWSAGTPLTIGRMLNGGKAQGSPSSGNAGLAFSTTYGGTRGGAETGAGNGFTELYNAVEFSNTSGSFGLLKPRGGAINTKAFQVTSSLFKLPVFSDFELNYQGYENQYSTGSLTGSVDRDADVIVGQNLGEMWFDSDKNAIGYTYSSRSLISQSLDFGTFTMATGSGYFQTSSQGFFTQSFYSHSVVTCYLTGSQI